MSKSEASTLIEPQLSGPTSKNMSVHITHFMRRPRESDFSIERLYQDVRGALPEDCQATVWNCCNYSNGLWPRFQDILLARDQQGDVNHVTGDVHYLTYLLDPKRTVLTIHDLVSLERLRGIKRWTLWFLWYWLPVPAQPRRCRYLEQHSPSSSEEHPLRSCQS